MVSALIGGLSLRLTCSALGDCEGKNARKANTVAARIPKTGITAGLAAGDSDSASLPSGVRAD